MSLIPLGILAASAVQPPAGSYDLIETISVGTAVASVTFSNLNTYASTYRHLQIRAVGQGTGVLGLRFNGVTTSGAYRDHRLYGFSGSVGSDTINTDRIYIGRGGEQSPMVIDILDAYSSSKNKTVRTLNGDLSGTPIIQLISGAWFSTNSTTSIELLTQGTWATTSRFSIYGIKG